MRKLFLFLALLTQSIFICTSFAQTGWVSLNMPQRNYKSINFVNAQTGFIISVEGYIEKTTDGGNNWFEINTGMPGGSTIGAGYFSTPELGSVTYMHQIFTTTDGGYTWRFSIQSASMGKSRYVNNTTGYALGFEYFPDLNPSNNHGYNNESSSGYTSYLYKSTNEGYTWFKIFSENFVMARDFFVKNSDSISVLADALYRTTDGGIEWKTTSFNVSPSISPKSFTDPYKDTIFACGTNYIIRSFDQGESWSLVHSQLGYNYFNKASFINSKIGYCAGDSGLMVYTSNAGASWIKQRTFVTKSLNDIAIINKDTIFAVGENGVVIRTYNGGITSAGEHITSVPENFSLSQNYPNPFNPNTVISYKLSVAGNISLNVYDANGRLIKILENGYKSAGNYSTNFSAEGLSSGVYYYSLTADGVLMDTKKAVVMK